MTNTLRPILVLTDMQTGERLELADPMQGCMHCGDDVEVHTWIAQETCDRA